MSAETGEAEVSSLARQGVDDRRISSQPLWIWRCFITSFRVHEQYAPI